MNNYPDTPESLETSQMSLKKRIQLKGMTLGELKEYFVEIGEDKFRGEQVFKWMYNDLAIDYSEMLNIPKKLRTTLAENTVLATLNTTEIEQSTSTGTKKFIYETSEKNKIESVIIPEEKRTTLYISTQVGCPLDCKFCATGLMGPVSVCGTVPIQLKLSGFSWKRGISNFAAQGRSS